MSIDGKYIESAKNELASACEQFAEYSHQRTQSETLIALTNAAIAQAEAAERQAQALERIAAALETMLAAGVPVEKVP